MSEQEVRARWDRDALIDSLADRFIAHPMLLGYNESDRLLIGGALAVAAVGALPLDDLADLLDERERLLAVVEAVENLIPPYPQATVLGPRWKALAAAVRAYRATTGEAIVCMDPRNCTRTDHAAGAGGTLVHLPPDGKIVPGLFDHGVPSDAATTGEAGQ